jgi:hypothetical protein
MTIFWLVKLGKHWSKTKNQNKKIKNLKTESQRKERAPSKTESRIRAEMAASMADLCRLCGANTLNIARNAIFEGEGRTKKYALKINECLALQVRHTKTFLFYGWNFFIHCMQETEEDQLPKNMCGECTLKLDLLSDFREKAFKTETALLTMAHSQRVKDEVNKIITSRA